jgi:hypothetical protein
MARHASSPRPDVSESLVEIGPQTPLRLKIAAALAYPDGSMTASGLRKEAARGRLVIERTAGKDYTTLHAIEEMRKLCRHQPKVRDCGSEKQGAAKRAGSPIQPSGLSSTESIKRAQGAARTIVAELKDAPSLPQPQIPCGGPKGRP